ncbi:MAG: hypothetical protein HQL95_14880, partial [Magnetococcales bacterium]|nr:hypothetical protein [Magnetococcales bacterium]
MPFFLDEEEEDAFKELFNISFGMTAASLSEMVDAEIELSGPGFARIPAGSVTEFIRGLYGRSVGLVGMRYRFIFPSDSVVVGMAVMLVNAADLGHFLEALHGSAVPEEMVIPLAEESMQL